jgi:hypothetical protein
MVVMPDPVHGVPGDIPEFLIMDTNVESSAFLPSLFNISSFYGPSR